MSIFDKFRLKREKRVDRANNVEREHVKQKACAKMTAEEPQKSEVRKPEPKLRMLHVIRSDASALFDTYVRNIVINDAGLVESLEVMECKKTIEYRKDEKGNNLMDQPIDSVSESVLEWESTLMPAAYMADHFGHRWGGDESTMVGELLESLQFDHQYGMEFSAFSVLTDYSPRYTYEQLRYKFEHALFRAFPRGNNYLIRNISSRISVRCRWRKYFDEHRAHRDARDRFKKQLEYERKLLRKKRIINPRWTHGEACVMCSL